MKVKVNNLEYWIDFEYEKKDNNVFTKCYIFDFTQTIIGNGYAQKSITDVHVKETGRKIAFGKAIESFDKETRTQFWNQYFDRKNYREKFSAKEVKGIIESIEDCHTIEEVGKTIQAIKEKFNIKTEE